MKPQKSTIPADELATFANLTARRLNQLANEGKIPTATRGQFPMPATIQALFRLYQADAASIARERLLKLAAQRKLVERKERIAAAIERQTYVETEYHTGFLKMIVQALENVPGRAASQLGLTSQQAVGLRDLIDDIRRDSWAEIEKWIDSENEKNTEK